MSNPIDIHDEIHALCTKLEIEPTTVKTLHIEPTTVKAIVYRTNDNGRFYLENLEPAQDEFIFKVTT